MSLGARALTIVVVTLVTAFSVRRFLGLARSREVVARPSGFADRTRAVPTLGGPAVFVVLLPALIVLATSAPTGPDDHPEARWIGTACVLAIGLFDDLSPLTVMQKSLALLVVCSAYLIVVDPSDDFDPLRLALQLGFMLLIVNAFNLVDVTDGLLIVVGCLAAIGLLGGSFLTSPLNRIECEVILGTLVAAFWFNRPPARIYLGDAGALPLGFLLASLFLVGFSGSSYTDGFAHLGAFAIPSFEVALIAPARIHAGLSPFLGSPDHFALRLHEQAGWSKERVLVTTVAVGLFFLVWCYVPSRIIRGPVGIVLGIASIVVAVAAYRICWRLAPPERDRVVGERRIAEEG